MWSGNCIFVSNSLAGSDDDRKSIRSWVQEIGVGLGGLREKLANISWAEEQKESGESGQGVKEGWRRVCRSEWSTGPAGI